MAASRRDIEGWFQGGVERRATHMVVACDTFDHEDYPIYAKAGEDPQAVALATSGKQMTRVMEVYALHLPMEGQMAEDRARHYDPPPAPTLDLEIPELEPSSAPTDNTRWSGLTAEEAITALEARLAASRRSGNVLRAHIVAAMLSGPSDSQAILLRALAVTEHKPRRPKRARRRARRLLMQAAEILEERP